MTSFIQPSFPAQHLGVTRVASAVKTVKSMHRDFDSTHTLAAMLLAAMVSSLVVVADHLMDTWADGHLMLAWVGLWVVGFVALGLFAGAARNLACAVIAAMNAWSARLAQTRADERMWVIAKSDPRVMADLISIQGQFEK
jgi:hypothetical protein